MDLLKKYWDKILLALTLVGLITVAVWLMISVESTLKQLAGGAQLYRAPKETIHPLDPSPITSAIEAIAHPIQCEFKGLPFGPTEVQVRTGEVIIVHETAKIALETVQRVPFGLIFKSYSWDPDKQEASNLQINFVSRNRTFIVSRIGGYVQDLFGNTGYKTIKFERKEALMERRGIQGKVLTDVSELTLQHEGEDPIVMTLLRETMKKEPVAHISCDPGWGMPSVPYDVRRGQQFKCGTTVYIVVDISSRQMIIKDAKSEETTTVPLRGEAPAESR